MASFKFHAVSAEAAELKAMIWAMFIAFDREWFDVDWISDAKVMVSRALYSADPLGWNTMNDYLMLHI